METEWCWSFRGKSRKYYVYESLCIWEILLSSMRLLNRKAQCRLCLPRSKKQWEIQAQVPIVTVTGKICSCCVNCYNKAHHPTGQPRDSCASGCAWTWAWTKHCLIWKSVCVVVREDSRSKWLLHIAEVLSPKPTTFVKSTNCGPRQWAAQGQGKRRSSNSTLPLPCLPFLPPLNTRFYFGVVLWQGQAKPFAFLRSKPPHWLPFSCSRSTQGFLSFPHNGTSTDDYQKYTNISFTLLIPL